MSVITAHRRLLVLLLVLLLVAGSCGGDDSADELSAEDDDTEQVDGEGDDKDTSEGDGAGDATTTTAGGGGEGDVATGGGSGGGATGNGGSGGGGGAAASQSGTIEPTQAGTYHITVDGTRSQGGQTAELPDKTLEVKPAQGSVQVHVTTTDDGSSRMELELEYRAEGAYIRRIAVNDSGFSRTFVFDPPALTAPASPAVGQKWSWSTTSENGTTTLKGDFEVLETDARLTIGGQEISTYKLRSVITTSGDVESTSNDTIWVSAEHRQIVKTEGTSEAQFGVITRSSEYTETLDSLTPS